MNPTKHNLKSNLIAQESHLIRLYDEANRKHKRGGKVDELIKEIDRFICLRNETYNELKAITI